MSASRRRDQLPGGDISFQTERSASRRRDQPQEEKSASRRRYQLPEGEVSFQ
jgi:hypothetical protein